MDFVDEIKTDELNDSESDDLFYKLLSGKDATETIQTSRGNFVVKFPKQKDIERIGLITAQRRMGIPARAFDVEAENVMYKCAVLDVVVKSGPKWYENAKNRNNTFSWRDMPDIDFVDEVYVKAHSFRQEIQKQLRLPEKETAGQNEREGVQDPVGNGLFQGVTSANM
ncbi:MAG: hypothetical protein LBB72_01475 [Spirochaetaceae bacterium]|jgi:hypothetical protein|nr:hypothetical protein [Spirochaetaceae bacterium]